MELTNEELQDVADVLFEAIQGTELMIESRQKARDLISKINTIQAGGD